SGCNDVCPNPEFLGRHRGLGVVDLKSGPVIACRRRVNDAVAHLPGLVCGPGQHDADHASYLHAACHPAWYRSDLVWRSVLDLHAAGPPTSAAWASADDYAGGGTSRGNNRAHLQGRCAVSDLWDGLARALAAFSCHCHVAAELARGMTHQWPIQSI